MPPELGHWALGLFVATMALLLLPKLWSYLVLLRDPRRLTQCGGAARAAIERRGGDRGLHAGGTDLDGLSFDVRRYHADRPTRAMERPRARRNRAAVHGSRCRPLEADALGLLAR